MRYDGESKSRNNAFQGSSRLGIISVEHAAAITSLMINRSYPKLTNEVIFINKFICLIASKMSSLHDSLQERMRSFDKSWISWIRMDTPILVVQILRGVELLGINKEFPSEA